MRNTLSRQIKLFMAFSFLFISMIQPVFADLSKQDAIKIAQKRNGGGKVLGVVENTKNDKKSYDIKLISEGKVRILTVEE